MAATKTRPDPLPAPPPRIDERVLGAGTSVRFVMLLFVLLASSGSMMLTIILGMADGDRIGCELAAGAGPADSSLTRTARTASQAVAFDLCQSVWAPSPPWWQLALWPVLLAVSALTLLLLLPRWKARPGRVVPLAAMDSDGELVSLFAELARATGLSRMPRVVVDPAATGSGAVVFGRTGRPIVCLDGGLIVGRHRAPARFRAVLLHELAHIANRDVTLTYATITLWRVFLGLVLVPYLLWEGYVIHGVLADGGMPTVDRPMLLTVFTVALVYLARSDVLRSREIYADLTALRWGADPHGWAGDTPGPPEGPVRRALGPFLVLWRTHPRFGMRQGALTDPAPLFRTPALMFFLIGTSVVLVEMHLLYYLAPYNLATIGVTQAITVVTAALITAVTGIALWRTVAYAVFDGTRVPSGLRAGGWLGAGIAVGTVLSSSSGSGVWLPERPQLLLVPVATGMAFGWWITQCAHLWTRSWRGRTLRPVLLISLAAVVPVLALWLAWWHLMGVLYASGFTARTDGVVQWVLAWLPSAAPGDPGRLPGITTVLPLFGSVTALYLIPLALTMLWVVPLGAWAVGPAAGRQRWLTGDAALPAGGVLPPLRRVLLPGLLGGALACVAFLGIQAYLHTGQPAPEGRGGLYALRYTAGTLLALTGPAGLAAFVASLRTPRFRLLSGLAAAQITILLGLAGVTVIASIDGCTGFLNVLQDNCAWRPAWRLRLFPYLYLLHVAVVVGTVLATTLAGAAALTSTALRRVRPAAGPRTSDSWAHNRVTRAQRVGVALLCLASVGLSGTADATRLRTITFTVDLTKSQDETARLADIPDAPVSDATRARQVDAWYDLGGRTLLEELVARSARLTTAIDAATGGSWESVDRQLRPACDEWRRAAGYERIWFRVPDEETQADWRAIALHAEQGGRRCAEALTAGDNTSLLTALRELITAGRCTTSVNTRIDGLLRADGRKGTVRPPVQGVVCDRAE